MTASLKHRAEAAAEELERMSAAIYIAVEEIVADDISARLTRVRDLLSELAAAVPEWRPISELHEDDEGKLVLTIGGRRTQPTVEPAEPIYWAESAARNSPATPTHFQPLPTPPEVKP